MDDARVFYPRLPAVALGITVTTAVLGVRLVWLGASAPDPGVGPTPRQSVRAQRGALWDRNGSLLATESHVYDLGAAANELGDRADCAAEVAPLLGMPSADLLASLSRTDSRWLPLARGISANTAQSIEQLDLPGLYLTANPRRTYPLAAAAGHLTGFVNVDGESFYGIEALYDAELSGHPGDLAGNFGTEPRGYIAPVQGTALVLTIDRRIQLAAAEALAEAVERESAVGGSVVVIDPATGEILASTSLPAYDPNRFAEADAELFPDPVVSAQYEPGSVVKAMTMAAALDSGVVGVNSTYEDTGLVEVAGLTIANWDRLAHGQTSMSELLIYSLNVGAVHLAQALGPQRFYAYVEAFGFGQATGVDLAGEITGQVHVPADEEGWYAGNLATNSFGQGMAATPLQVAAAFAALANDGRLMAPHVVAARVLPDGRLAHVEPRMVRQVVAPATARAVRGMLGDVVADRVTKAAIPGHVVAGKTGTSQIPIEGGYDTDGTIASFAGFLPADDPRVVILVKIDRPDNPRGSDAAAPVFRQVAKAVIAALDIPPRRGMAMSGAGVERAGAGADTGPGAGPRAHTTGLFGAVP